MKKHFNLRLVLLIVLLSPLAMNAQLTNGSYVTIKNSSSGKYIKAKGIAVDSPIVHGQLNPANIFFGQWRVAAAPGGGYMFQTRINSLYLGIKPVTGSGNGFIIQRRLTTENRDELTWILVRTGPGYQLKNKKNNRMLSVEGSLSGENSNLVHTLNPNPAGTIWVFTPVSSSPATSATGTGRTVLYDVMLNYIAVSEATRNRIDNGDCRRVFGQVKTELWELDDNNQKKRRIAAYENKPEYVFNQLNYLSAPTEGLSYYQDNRTDAAKNEMEKVTYNIPEDLLNNRKVMLVIKTYIGTRHKDSDLSSYDAVKMKQEKQSTYILDNRASRTETIQAITERYFNNMTLTGSTINGSLFEQGDDTHKLWVTFTWKKQ